MSELPLRERNKQRIRDRIVKAAFELFQQVGYHETTMDDIAARAEISRGTLFNYFPTKDSLLRPFVQDIFQTRIRPAVSIYLNEQHSTLQTLRFLFMNIREHVLTIPHIDQAFKQEFMRPKELGAGGRKRYLELTDIVLLILQHGEQRGEIRTDMPIEKLARYIGVLYVSIFYSTVLDLEPKLPDYSHEIDELLAFIESGLGTGD